MWAATSTSLRKAIFCSRFWAWRQPACQWRRCRASPGSPAVCGLPNCRTGWGPWAVQFYFDIRLTLPALAILLALKLIASAVSVGSGFRGGLFSSSLFIGALLGAVFAQGAAYFSPALE